jgi:hypothetical protein
MTSAEWRNQDPLDLSKNFKAHLEIWQKGAPGTSNRLAAVSKWKTAL